MTKKAKPTKIIFMGSTLEIIREDLKKIEYGSNFMYDKENELWFVLSEAFYELVFLLNRFETAQNKLFTENSSDVEYFFNSMNEFSPDQVQDKSMIVEFHAIDLSVYFKSFLVISKSVLDKLVPLYSYRFSDSLRQFDKKGVRLIKNIQKE